MAEAADESDDEEYDVLSSDNLDTFRWKNKVKINICKCLKPITPIQLSRCRKTLTKIWFQYPLTFHNIKVVLLNCPSLLDLSFEDVLVDEYRRYNANTHASKIITANSNPSKSRSATPTRTKTSAEAESQSQEQESSNAEVEAESRTRLENHFEIYHDNLRIIEITTSSEKLSRNEYWILDFLTRGVNFKQLEALTFWKNLVRVVEGNDINNNNQNHQFQWQGFSQNEVMEQCGDIDCINNNIVANFILKNRYTLKTLWIGGSGFTLYNAKDIPIKDLKVLKELQLDSFTFSYSGPLAREITFVENQKSLQKIVLFSRYTLSTKSEYERHKLRRGRSQGQGQGYLNFPDNSFEEAEMETQADSESEYNFPAIPFFKTLNCVGQNARTLTEIIIYPKIIINKCRASLIQENFVENFTINCDIFSSCISLKVLTIGLICFQYLDENGVGNPTLLGAKLLNIHRIPVGLTILQMYAEDFLNHDLQLLALNLKEFRKLEKFTFSSSPLKQGNHYVVNVEWVKTMARLPCITEFSFFNHIYENSSEVIAFTSSQDQSHGQRLSQGQRAGMSTRSSQTRVRNFENDYESSNELVNEGRNRSRLTRIRMGQVIQVYGRVPGDCFRVSRE